MSTWNYRVIKNTYHLGKQPFHDYSVNLVVYEEGETVPSSWSPEPTRIAGIDKDDLLNDLQHIKDALYKPILIIVDNKLVETEERLLDGTEYRD